MAENRTTCRTQTFPERFPLANASPRIRWRTILLGHGPVWTVRALLEEAHVCTSLSIYCVFGRGNHSPQDNLFAAIVDPAKYPLMTEVGIDTLRLGAFYGSRNIAPPQTQTTTIERGDWSNSRMVFNLEVAYDDNNQDTKRRQP